LHVVGQRRDGYHLLEAEMVSLDFGDELEISAGSGLEVLDALEYLGSGEAQGLDVPTDARNLVQRALLLCGIERHVRLTKRIAPGAGLGGGSADAAAVLRYARFSDLEAAASLGADVPFCLNGGRALVGGIGERIEALDFEDVHFVIVTPDLAVSTAEVYRAYDAIGSRAEHAVNDLEDAALVVEPRLASLKAMLADATGAVPTLAGSGSTYFFECAKNDCSELQDAVTRAVVRAGLRAIVRTARTFATELP
jgi:4-diphosphocytidyl-2-C-methyl-D-erythritol kinase